jgi:hypothetical protein
MELLHSRAAEINGNYSDDGEGDGIYRYFIYSKAKRQVPERLVPDIFLSQDSAYI